MMYSNVPYEKENCNCKHGECSNNCDKMIVVEGIGRVNVQPDITKITLGAQTIDEDVKIAQQKNKEIMSKVINGIKASGVKDEDIKTVTYYVRPKYDYVKGEQIFKGFEVKHIIQVVVRDIENTDEILYEAIENGANIQQGIEFLVSEPQKYYQDALTLAAFNSKSKAITIADSYKVSINEEPIKVTEKTSSIGQARNGGNYNLMVREDKVIETGTIEIVAKIEAEFQII